MKKVLCFIIFALLIMPTSVAFAEASPEAIIEIDQIEMLFDAMINEANNANIELCSDQYIEIPVSIGDLSGVVIIEDKAIEDEFTLSGTDYHDIVDGDRVNTTTLKADKLLGGEMILRVYYTASNEVTHLNATSTSEDFSPPVGYTNDGTSSWVHKNQETIIGGTGSYTMKALGAYPLTIKVKTEISLTSTPGTIQVNYWKEV
ncbi:hypothetical protein SAMN05446037_1009131 [Anaerovirgula multivorans]|uniref:Uncharacterized protein n=1 Tax=Anaerovirgula multivorans TaxID=312168 RepID=A0A239E930_9FIRM|nr:hypothetical protein [Anaerovirgula multivorans]SNS41126.1 hypothetical protein SAMN05446037_1009131 [Anaerovirgula multivorans]